MRHEHVHTRRSLLEHKHRRDNVKDMLRKAFIFAACVTLAWAQARNRGQSLRDAAGALE